PFRNGMFNRLVRNGVFLELGQYISSFNSIKLLEFFIMSLAPKTVGKDEFVNVVWFYAFAHIILKALFPAYNIVKYLGNDFSVFAAPFFMSFKKPFYDLVGIFSFLKEGFL